MIASEFEKIQHIKESFAQTIHAALKKM